MHKKVNLDFLIPISGILLFLILPGSAATGARAGLRLCGELLIPALLPISVLAGCLVQMGGSSPIPRPAIRFMEAVFSASGACASAFLLGQLGGFPLGAQLIAGLYREGRIGKAEAEQISAFCNNAGPAFLIGTAGVCLGSPFAGAALLVIQLLATVSAGLLLRKRIGTASGRVQPPAQRLPFSQALPRAIGSSAGAMLRLTGAVVFFQAFLSCLKSLLPLNQLSGLARAGLTGALELSGGFSALQNAGGTLLFPLAAALVNWGGLCVHLQAAEALGSAGLSVKPYLRGKLTQACFGWVYGGLYAILQRAIGICSLPFLFFALILFGFFLFLKNRHWKTEKAVL